MSKDDPNDADGALARLAPWFLLWIAAPAPLWIALAMAWWFRS